MIVYIREMIVTQEIIDAWWNNKKVKIIEEKWVDCYCDDRYQVSNLGLVKNKKTGRLLMPFIKNTGRAKRTEYYWANIGGETHKIHQLVFRSFRNGRIERGVIDHVNGISLDNRLVNLTILSASENSSKGNRDDSYGRW